MPAAPEQSQAASGPRRYTPVEMMRMRSGPRVLRETSRAALAHLPPEVVESDRRLARWKRAARHEDLQRGAAERDEDSTRPSSPEGAGAEMPPLLPPPPSPDGSPRHCCADLSGEGAQHCVSEGPHSADAASESSELAVGNDQGAAAPMPELVEMPPDFEPLDSPHAVPGCAPEACWLPWPSARAHAGELCSSAALLPPFVAPECAGYWAGACAGYRWQPPLLCPGAMLATAKDCRIDPVTSQKPARRVRRKGSGKAGVKEEPCWVLQAAPVEPVAPAQAPAPAPARAAHTPAAPQLRIGEDGKAHCKRRFEVYFKTYRTQRATHQEFRDHWAKAEPAPPGSSCSCARCRHRQAPCR
eukprot:TRINITY_DN4140_c1_g1_i1.p1 TRINITY_DN4140_c1_g1~~TRINITY_DN4140_c1_g1_i1.p1  ORF type:complete len:396 (+),score=53.07 TRINITY_DN4140_c1_g1_i1:120-1190(+)